MRSGVPGLVLFSASLPLHSLHDFFECVFGGEPLDLVVASEPGELAFGEVSSVALDEGDGFFEGAFASDVGGHLGVSA